MRQQRSLAGTWQFQPDPQGQTTLSELTSARTITVPLPWQAAFPDLQAYSGYAWYQHEFTVAADWLAGEVLLTFGAVDYWCEVFVNGSKVGEHEGGYTPFTFTIRQHLREGANQLAVRVYDTLQTGVVSQRHPHYPLEADTKQPPFDATGIPHGKQEWYINVGGIWQDVTLTSVPHTYIEQVKITPALDGTAQVVVRVAGAGDDWIVDAVIEWEGQGAAHAVHTVSDSRDTSLTLHVDAPHLWSLENPALYTLRVRVGEDEVSTRFGFREITTRDGKIYLNNQPVYLVAALDQDFYLDTIYTVPSEAYLRDEFQKSKELGLNCLRCHIKVPDPLYLELADEMGLLIWAEIPSWRTFYPKGTLHPQQNELNQTIRNRVEATLHEMIERDFNHPSLVIWTMVNEDWGTMLPLSASDRTWVNHLYDLCKQLDPTRLVVDNSACPVPWGVNMHVKSDLDDWHIYTNIPDAARAFVNTVEQLNMRPLWTYSSHGDTTRRGDEPLIVSEFGNWGLSAVQPYLDENGGSEPAWFDLGPWWSNWEGEPGWMKGVLERYAALGLDKVFGDYDSFVQASQWHQYQALKFEIEAMRCLPAIMGYVITELTDIYWECNGLMDFARRPKIYHDVLRRFNTPDVVVPQFMRYAYWDDETVSLALSIARFSPKPGWNAAKLRVQLGDKVVEMQPTAIPAATVIQAEQQTWTLSPVTQAAMQAFTLQVTDTQGNELAMNTVDILVLPTAARKPAYTGTLAVVENVRVSSTAFPQAVRDAGYTTSDLTSNTRIAVTTSPTPALLDWIRTGGDALFICRGASPFFWAQGRGGNYGGNWMSAWSWLRPGVHRRLDFAELNPLKLPFMNVMPQHTVPGLPVEAAEYQADFLAGQFTGWINHPAIHTVQFQYGQGRVIMTTFSLAESLANDPVATAMFHDLIDHLAEGRCQPNLRGNW